MANSIDANSIFDFQELDKFEELSDLNDQIKKLEARKQLAVAAVKSCMEARNVDHVTYKGHNFAMIDSSRRTVGKTTKDTFISELISMGKQHLLKTSIEPDLDSIFAEVDAGTLEKGFVDQYVKVTPIVTLRVS